jgi:pimeloyl-ACP methyl ester carboxylesterase
MKPGSKSVLLVAAAGATAGSVAAVRRIERNWETNPDIVPPGERHLPGNTDERTVRTDDGAELAVTVAGPADTGAPTVVLAHGGTNARRVWAPVVHELLRAGRRVVAYDQRGHGRSTTGAHGFTIKRLGDDLRSVLEHVDARDAVLVGHSMGGMTIQSLATHHPEVVDDRVDGIVLVATAASGLSRNAPNEASAAKLLGSKALERVLRTRAGLAFFRGTVGKQVRKADLQLSRDLFLATSPEARSGWLTAMLGMDLREGIATIDVPVTVLVGSEDKLTPPDRAAELADTIPGARLVRLGGLGHMLPLEAPKAVAEPALTLASIGQSVRSPA